MFCCDLGVKLANIKNLYKIYDEKSCIFARSKEKR